MHGGPTAGHSYLRPEWDNLSKFAKVVYYDQRGCGKSEKAGCYSWREHIQDLKRIIETVSKNKRVFLAGSSWGSTLGLLYAYTYPEDIKGIILSGTYHWIGKGEAAKPCADYAPLNSFKDTIMYRHITYSLEDTVATKREKTYESHPYSSSFTNNSMTDAPTLIQLKKINTPVLLFKSKGECQTIHNHVPLEGANQFMGILENLEVYTIERGCHDPWLTHTNEFFGKCNVFMEANKRSAINF